MARRGNRALMILTAAATICNVARAEREGPFLSGEERIKTFHAEVRILNRMQGVGPVRTLKCSNHPPAIIKNMPRIIEKMWSVN